MEEFGKDKLKKALQELPSKVAPEQLWDSIQEEIDSNYPADQNYQALQQAVNDLPAKKAAPVTFEDIIAPSSNHQGQAQVNRLKKIRPYFKYIGWAASVLLVLATSVFWQFPATTESVDIVYSEQTIEWAPKLVEFSDLHQQDEVLSFIKANCKAFQQECSQEEFKELLDQYIQLESDRQKLIDAIQQNQEQKQLVTYLVRLEKKKTELGKKLMQTFI